MHNAKKTENEWTQNMVKKMYWWKRMPMHIGATLIVGKKGRREIGKCFPTKISSLRLVSTPEMIG